MWDIGGGGLEHGHSVEDTVRKEINEEFGTDVLDFEFLGYRDVHREHESAKTHWVALDFKVHIDENKVKNNEPHKFEKLEWFHVDALPREQELHSQLPTFLKQYIGRL